MPQNAARKLPPGLDALPSGKIRARYRDADGKQHAATFDAVRPAQRWRHAQLAAVDAGTHVDPGITTTVAEYAQAWAATRPHRPTTARRVAGLIRVHIAGTPLGDRRLAAVRPSEVQAWASDRARVLSPSTLRNVVGLLRSIYASAVLDRLCASSPVVRIVLPRAERERVVPLTVEQVRALADAMPERNRAMVITQAGLGLRIGELLALRVQDFDFLRRTARVEWQIPTDSRTRSEPKTPRSRRTLPLPAVVADALAAHLAAYPPADDGTIFHTRAGRPWGHAYYGTVLFGAAARSAGLPEGTTTHALRHAYASWLLAAGESVVAVAERLGHENAQLVLSTYGHLMPGTEERTRRALDDAFSVTPVSRRAPAGR